MIRLKTEPVKNILGEEFWDEVCAEKDADPETISIEINAFESNRLHDSLSITLNYEQANTLGLNLYRFTKESLVKGKTEAALKPYDGGWNNPLQEAIERIADHAYMFDARDLMAFRYICDLAGRYKDLCK